MFLFHLVYTFFHLKAVFIALVGKYSSPSGKSSFTSSAYPAILPSLNTLNVYTTVFPLATSTGSFECTYLYSLFSVIVNTGALLVISLSLTPVINFLKAKSNLFITNFSKSSSSCCPGIYVSPQSISASL